MRLLRQYCINLDIKLVFSSYKISRFFSVKDSIPFGLRSNVVANCNACYVQLAMSVKLHETLPRLFGSF